MNARILLQFVVYFLLSLSVSAQDYDLLDLGWKCFRRNQPDSAILYYDQALKKFPDDPVALNFRGQAYTRSRNFRSALADFNKALKLKGDSNEIIYQRISAYEGLEKLDSAVVDVEYLLTKTSSTKPTAMLIAAKAAFRLQQGRIPEAERLAGESLALDSLNFYGLNVKIQVLANASRYREALKESLGMIRQFPGASDGYYFAGLMYSNLGDWVSGKRYIKKSLVLGASSRTYALLAMIYSYNSSYDSALYFSDKAIAMEPNSANNHFSKGVVFFNSLKYAASIECFDRSIRMDPKRDSPYQYRGKAYYGLKKYNLAQNDFNKAIQLNNRNSEAYVFLGYISKDQGKKTVTCDYWRRAYALGAVDIKDEMDRYCK